MLYRNQPSGDPIHEVITAQLPADYQADYNSDPYSDNQPGAVQSRLIDIITALGGSLQIEWEETPDGHLFTSRGAGIHLFYRTWDRTHAMDSETAIAVVYLPRLVPAMIRAVLDDHNAQSARLNAAFGLGE